MSHSPTPPPPSPSLPSSRPRPVAAAAVEAGRLVPENWLEDTPLTRGLLALNAAIFLVQVALTRHVIDLPTHAALALGATYTLTVIREARWETLVTACFLHDGIVHVAMNMLVLWQAGPLVERGVGAARMAPMYLAAGAFGNTLSVAYASLTRGSGLSVGASGAISGVIAAACVVALRTGGFRAPLTQALVRWLALLLAFGVFANFGGGHIDNAAHFGGALAGGAIAALWRRGHRYSAGATTGILAACAAVLVACIATVAFHDRTDRFAAMTFQERIYFTRAALEDGRCPDARDGLLAVERLRALRVPDELRVPVEMTCGHVDP